VTPTARASSTIEVVMARALRSPQMSATKLRSILRVETGSECRCDRELWPVPKSSIATA
jgi:hypothetical protein